MPFLSLFSSAYILCAAGLLGLVFGSFCNAWAWRIVHGESIVRGRSHCALCGHVLAPQDLVPLLSWLALRGKCRWCGASISVRYPVVELISGVYYVSIVLRYGLTLDTLRLLILGSLLLTASLVDLDTLELPDGLLLGAALAALLRLPDGWKDALLGGLAVAGPLLLLVLLADRVVGRETMGGGDIKLVALLGLHFGPAQTLFLLILACVLGLLPGRKGGPFPFGPALSLSAWLTALFGPPLVDWYLSLF